MFTRQKRFASLLAFLALLFLVPFNLSAQDSDPNDPNDPNAVTRPRLSFIDGSVSFWRPGADDWSDARINTPLAPGDQVYTGDAANVELQVGSRDFIRAGADTQVGFENQDPDFLQFKVTGGHVALDLRSLSPGQTVEVDTPNAIFTTRQAGYYRVDVGEDSTTFVSRNGGRATIKPEGGVEASIVSNDQLVVAGTAQPQIERYAASSPDPWDQWNTDRSNALAQPVSQRYVSQGVYGLDSLDSNGSWNVQPSYGWVWRPNNVPVGWAPYSAGRWLYDGYYGWSWLDDAAWGWAPYHYGRWVYTGGYWGWAPGPVVVRPYYAPALVAFYGGVNFGVGFSIGAPVGWVSLSWGEPFVPWWGPVGFYGRPCWRGWGGPRVVNNVVINKTTIINNNDIRNYRNRGVNNGLVTVKGNTFGRGPVQRAALGRGEVDRMRPLRGGVGIAPDSRSLSPGARSAQRPPRSLDRPVLASRAQRDAAPGRAGVRGGPAVTRPPTSSSTSNNPRSERLTAPSNGVGSVGNNGVRGIPRDGRVQTGRAVVPPPAVSTGSQTKRSGRPQGGGGGDNSVRQVPASNPGSVRQSPPPVPSNRRNSVQQAPPTNTGRLSNTAPRSRPAVNSRGMGSNRSQPPAPPRSRAQVQGSPSAPRAAANRNQVSPRVNGTAQRQTASAANRAWQGAQTAPRPPSSGQVRTQAQPRMSGPSVSSRPSSSFSAPSGSGRGVGSAPRAQGGGGMGSMRSSGMGMGSMRGSGMGSARGSMGGGGMASAGGSRGGGGSR